MLRVSYPDQEQFLIDRLGEPYRDIVSAVVSYWNEGYEEIIYEAFQNNGHIIREGYYTGHYSEDNRRRMIELSCGVLVNFIAFETVKNICVLKHLQENSVVNDAMAALLKDILSVRLIESLFLMYEKLSNGGTEEVQARPLSSHRKKVIFNDPSMTFKRIRVQNDISAAELGRRIHSERGRQRFADLEYGYLRPSAWEIAMICTTFGECLSDWRRASPDVETVIRRYERGGLNSIDALMTQLADKHNTKAP